MWLQDKDSSSSCLDSSHFRIQKMNQLLAARIASHREPTGKQEGVSISQPQSMQNILNQTS